MSVFPLGFDPRADVVGLLQLVMVNTVDGDFRFMLGQDGVFTDSTGEQWWGSSLFDLPGMEMAMDGLAPSGSLGMSYFQDPESPDLSAQIADLGADYVKGRALRFFVQPLLTHACLYQPEVPPVQWMQRTMTAISFALNGPTERRIALHFEGVFAGRNIAPGRYYTTADHALMLGVENPTLSLMPQSLQQDEPLFK